MKTWRLLLFVLLTLVACNQPGSGNRPVARPGADAEEHAGVDTARLQHKVRAAKAFCIKRRFDTTHCILVDMRIHSGNRRLLLWNFAKDTVQLAALVSHGCGAGPWGKDHSREQPVFSNANNSHCSALGRYKIGSRGSSQWGIGVNYLLLGLDTSNSNALQREIVLHSWDDVPDEVIYPRGTPEGWGCPAVSNMVMKQLDGLLRAKRRPVLLWIYY